MLDQKQLEHLAQLSRLELTAAEKVKFLHQLQSILDFVSVLAQVDTKKVEPFSPTVWQPPVGRPDQPVVFSDRAALLASAPLTEQGYIKTKPIFKHNEN